MSEAKKSTCHAEALKLAHSRWNSSELARCYVEAMEELYLLRADHKALKAALAELVSIWWGEEMDESDDVVVERIDAAFAAARAALYPAREGITEEQQ